jgi:hypothetical protein
MSEESSAAAEKSERRMALKIRLGAKLFPKTFLIMESEMRFFIHFGKTYSQESFPFA